MNYKKIAILTLSAALFLVTAVSASAKEYKALDKKEQSIVLISAYTANGDIEKLKPALIEGLESGLTVNEVKEIVAHLYAYVGFPRALNAQTAFMILMDEREKAGIKDEVGKAASPVPANYDRDKYGAELRAMLSGLDKVPPEAKWQKFNPVMDQYLKEHLFADIFIRDVLSHKQRELVTISALAALHGTAGQLRYHMGAAMNVGNSEAELKEFVSLIKEKVGTEEGKTASEVLTAVLDSRK